VHGNHKSSEGRKRVDHKDEFGVRRECKSISVVRTSKLYTEAALRGRTGTIEYEVRTSRCRTAQIAHDPLSEPRSDVISDALETMNHF
jgi:hypothetical protein